MIILKIVYVFIVAMAMNAFGPWGIPLALIAFVYGKYKAETPVEAGVVPSTDPAGT